MLFRESSEISSIGKLIARPKLQINICYALFITEIEKLSRGDASFLWLTVLLRFQIFDLVMCFVSKDSNQQGLASVRRRFFGHFRKTKCAPGVFAGAYKVA